jgi:hypothetical protein
MLARHQLNVPAADFSTAIETPFTRLLFRHPYKANRASIGYAVACKTI